MSDITITIPMDPPRALLPNQSSKQGHWGKRADTRRETREIAKYAALEHVNGKPIAGPVEVQIHAAFGYKRVTPDIDGVSAACKSFIDGIVDAGILYDDDQIKRLVVTSEKLHPRKSGERRNGWTRFTITEIPT